MGRARLGWCWFVVCAVAAPASADYIYPEQARALDALRANLAANQQDLDSLVSLSRLLSAPCDQCEWLLNQLPSPGAALTTTQREALAAIQTRLGVLRTDARLIERDCAALATLDERIEALLTTRQESLWTVTDAAALATQWADRSDGALANAQPNDLVALAARGIPSSALPGGRNNDAFEPFRTFAKLAESRELPPMWEVLQLRDDLATARASLSDGAGPAEIAFDVAQGYVDLALHQSPRGAFTDLARRAEAADLWLLTILADALAAASGTALPARAQASLGRVEQVAAAAGADWSALRGWLERAGTQDLGAYGELPLDARVDATRDAARQRFEQAFLQARGQPEAAFAAMQRAKAADVHPRFAESLQPVTTSELSQLLRVRRPDRSWRTSVNAYIELLRISSDGGYYAFSLIADDQAELSNDRYIPSIGNRHADAAAAVRAALPPEWQAKTDRQLIVAPDGVLGPAWNELESDLQSATSDSTSAGWYLLTPTAAALRPGTWSVDAALRWQWQSARRAGAAEPAMLRRRGAAPYSFGVGGGDLPQNVTGFVLHYPIDRALQSRLSRLSKNFEQYSRWKRALDTPAPVFLFVTAP